jgi:leucyl-tRNA synthetase
MGMGLLEGEKMSSSKGHVRLPGEAIDRFGADTVRFFLLNSAEPWQDFDWRADEVGSTRNGLERFWNRAQEVIEADVPAAPDLQPVDRWLLSKLQGTIRAVTEALDDFETRTASQEAFYRFEEHLRWYRRRTDTDRPAARWTLREVLDARIRLLAPFTPFVANELYEQLHGVPADDAGWPEPDPELESAHRELAEELVADLHEDVEEVVEVTGTDPDTVRVYVAADWKRQVFDVVADVAGDGGVDVGAVMGQAMQRDALREKGDAVNDLAQEMVSFAREHTDGDLQTLRNVDEVEVYESAAEFLGREFDADVEVYREGADGVHDPADKARQSEPFRPAIHLE